CHESVAPSPRAGGKRVPTGPIRTAVRGPGPRRTAPGGPRSLALAWSDSRRCAGAEGERRCGRGEGFERRGSRRRRRLAPDGRSHGAGRHEDVLTQQPAELAGHVVVRSLARRATARLAHHDAGTRRTRL